MESSKKSHYTIHEEVAEDMDELSEKKISLFYFIKRSDYPLIAVGFLSMAICSATGPLISFLYGRSIDLLGTSLKKKNDELIRKLGLYLGIVFCLSGLKMIFMWLGIFFWMQFGERQALRARRSIFYSTMNRRMRWIEKQHNFMGKISQANRSIEELRVGTSESIGLLLMSGCTILGSFMASMFFSWSLTLLILVSSPFMFMLSSFFGKRAFNAAKAENKYSELATKVLEWFLTSPKTVKLSNTTYHELARFKTYSESIAKSFFKFSMMIAANQNILRFLALTTLIEGYWFASYMIRTNRLSVGDAFACFSLCFAMASETSEIPIFLANSGKARAAIANILNFVEGADYCLEEESGIYPSDCKGEIEFQNVHFKYDINSPSVLSNTSFKVDSGDFAFITGKSGSGKSTICQLLVKIYTPDSGFIRIDGHNCANLSSKWLFENITILHTTCTVFNDTFLNNLCVAAHEKLGNKGDHIEHLLEQSIKFAELNELVDKLGGINAKINSAVLSGGEMQRISLARARIRDTPIMIIDEGISSLDPRSREGMINKIRLWRRGKTTIIISHDPNLIKKNDKVFCLNNGIISNSILNNVLNVESEKNLHASSNAHIPLEGLKTTSSEEESSLADKKNKDFMYNADSMISVNNGESLLSIFKIMKVFKFTRNVKVLYISGLAMSFLEGCCGPVFSYSFSMLISNLLLAKEHLEYRSSNIKWTIISLIVVFLNSILGYLSHLLLAYSGGSWILSIRKQVFDSLTEETLQCLNTKAYSAAEIKSLMMNDTRDLRLLISVYIPILLKLCLILFTCVIWTMLIGPKLAALGVSSVVLVAFCTIAYSYVLQITEIMYKKKVQSLEVLQNISISEIRSINYLNLKTMVLNEFDIGSLHLQQSGGKRAVATGFGVSLGEFVRISAANSMLYYGIRLVILTEYSSSQLFQILTIFSFSMGIISNLVDQMPEVTRGRRAGSYLTKILDFNGRETERPGITKPIFRADSPAVSFRDVSFRYPTSNNYSLKHASFVIPSGKTTAIVGKSGSGKSTIASLIVRLFEALPGSIEVFGYDVSNIDLEWLRNKVILVDQFPRFFDGTFFDNLVYGIDKYKVSKWKIEHYLKMTGLYYFVLSFPNGIYSNMPKEISTGQLKRLAIVRALLREPKVLILDETISNLDNLNSNRLLKKLVREKPSSVSSIIIITHDIKVIDLAEEVLEINNGKVSRLPILQYN